MNKIAACLWLVCCWGQIAFAQTDTAAPELRCKPYEQLLIYVFPNLKNPFEPPFPESIAIYPTTDPPLNRFEFIGIKIGDVNNTANPSQ